MGKLFGADGIRGIADQHPLTVEATERLGRVLATWIRTDLLSPPRPACLIAADTRESCQRLKSALTTGLRYGGVRVVDAKVVPTAAVSYLMAVKGYFDLGVMISASHNPTDQNGIKVFGRRNIKISDETEQLVEALFFGSQRLSIESRPAPYDESPTYADDYAAGLASEFRDIDWSWLKLVLDCANGAAFRVAPQLCENLHLRYQLVNASPNGANINFRSGSEFVRAAPLDFVRDVRRHDAQFFVAVDGDADRVVIVDEAGHFFDGDVIIASLAQALHDRAQLESGCVVITPMSNTGLTNYLRGQGLQTLEVNNGDKYITRKLLTQNFTLGGEQIGHIIIHDNRTRLTGDGLRTALVLLAEGRRIGDRSLWGITADLHKLPQINASVYTGRIGSPAPDSIPGLHDLLENTARKIPDLARPIVCRPASTEPTYRLMLEAYLTPVEVLAWHAVKIAEHIQQSLGRQGGFITIHDCLNGGTLREPHR